MVSRAHCTLNGRAVDLLIIEPVVHFRSGDRKMTRGIKRPDLDNIAIADAYRSGQTTVEIAAKYNVHHVAINNRLRKMGIEIRKAQRRSPIDQSAFLERVSAAYRSGEPMPDIAAREGVGRSTINRALRDASVQTRRHGTRAKTVRIPDDPVKLGYFAGLFDGEGNLQFKQNKHDGYADSTGCKLAIYSTTPSVMGWLTTNIGGKARWDYRRQERKGWLPCGSWEVYRALDVLTLLEWSLPVLLVKKKQAVKAIKFLRAKCHYDSPPTTTQSKRESP